MKDEAYIEDKVKAKLQDVHADHRLDEAIASAQEEFLDKARSEGGG